MGRERLETEFGQFSAWLVEAIEAVGCADPIPAACRGTGDPRLFERVSGALNVTGSTRFLDLGCGIGGPGAWLAREIGCSVTGADVMEIGVRGAASLFPGMRYVVASADSLPFASGSFGAAWALGVLETIGNKASALREVRRVISPGARLGVYGFVATKGGIEAPEADFWVSREELLELVDAAGFEVVAADLASTGPTPADWSAANESVRAELRRMHSGEPMYERAVADRRAFSRIWREGLIEPWIHILEKNDD